MFREYWFLRMPNYGPVWGMYLGSALAEAVHKQKIVNISSSVVMQIMMGNQTPPGDDGKKTMLGCHCYTVW